MGEKPTYDELVKENESLREELLNKKAEGKSFSTTMGGIMFVLILVLIIWITIFNPSKAVAKTNECKPPFGTCMKEVDCDGVLGQEYPGKKCVEKEDICCATKDGLSEFEPEENITKQEEIVEGEEIQTFEAG